MGLGTTSGTYTWTLTGSSAVVEAYERCGKLPSELTRHHWVSARRSVNLMLIDWVNRDGAPLWEVQGPTSIALVPETATYTLQPNTVSILDCYYTTVNGLGQGVDQDRIMIPMSRDEYAEFPNKLAPGIPTLYWHSKVQPPTITFYQNPQFGAPQYVVKYYWVAWLQDANLTGAETVDVARLGYEALCADLALWLSRKPTLVGKLDPDLRQEIKTHAAEAWANFASQNREDVPIYLRPKLEGYYEN